MPTTTQPAPTLAINHTVLVRRALRTLKRLKQDKEEFYADRAAHGWTSRNPYCKHGTYIGNPYGADYLCGYCEDGTTIHEMALYSARNSARIAQNEYATAYTFLRIYAKWLTEETDPARLTLLVEWIGGQIDIIRELEQEWN